MKLGGSTCPAMGRGWGSTASVGTVSPERADTWTGRLGVVRARSVREIGPNAAESGLDENGMYSSSLLREGRGGREGYCYCTGRSKCETNNTPGANIGS